MKQVFNPLSGTFDTVLSAASELPYDNTSSGLGSTNVQAAIDEVENNILNVWSSSVNANVIPDGNGTRLIGNSNNAFALLYVQQISAPDTILSLNSDGGNINVTNLGEATHLISYSGLVSPELRFYNKDDTGYSSFKAAAATLGAVNYTLPVDDGTSNQLLTTDGTGILSWTSNSGITALTGDATASGPGSVALTLATVNSNVGSFGSASSVAAITVNAKGLVTAATSTAIQIAESQVTNLVSDLALKAPLASPTLTGIPTAPTASQANNSTQLATTAYVDTGLATKQATGNYITALTGDVTAAGPGSVASTLATVNSNVGSFTNANITVNAKGLITAAANGSAGSGTVTTVSVASANGFAGSVATATTTPAITLTTTITGLLKGNATAISAATAADVTGQLLTGYTSGAGTVSATDSILQGIQKLNGNDALKADLGANVFSGKQSAPTFRGQPQSSDPGSPIQGDFFYSDGTSRTAGLWYYTGSAWAPVGANAGFIATDWVSYTPTLTGVGTATAVSFFWRRVGDSVQISGKFTSGTLSANPLTITLPNSITLDTAKLPGTNTADLGRMFYNISTTADSVPSANRGPAALTYDSTVGTSAVLAVYAVDLNNDAAGTYWRKDNTSAFTNSTTGHMVAFTAPISGWSSNTVAAVQSINAKAHNSATSISGTLATIVWTTEDYDTDSALASGVFTAPSTGKYHVDTALAVAGTFVLNNTSIMELQVNGTAKAAKTQYIPAAITNESISLSVDIALTAGDTVRVQYSNSGTTPTIVNSDTKNYFSISKIGN